MKKSGKKGGKKMKPGKPRFDEKTFEKAYGSLVRVIDVRGNLMGKDTHHARCQELMGMVLEEYKKWRSG